MKKVFAGEQLLTAEDVIAGLQEVAGIGSFPVEVIIADGKVRHLSYETEWQTGTTKPGGDFKESYETKKLTAEQIKKLDTHIGKLLKGI